MPTSSQFKILHTIERYKSLPSLLSPSVDLSTTPEAAPADALSSVPSSPRHSFKLLNLDSITTELGRESELTSTSDITVTNTLVDTKPPDEPAPEENDLDPETARRRSIYKEVYEILRSNKRKDFERSKKMLYNLGFRGLPGDSTLEIDKSLMKQRPGLRPKYNTNAVRLCADVGITLVMNGGLDTSILIDLSCLDQSTLRPTSVCFDAKPGIDVSHGNLWRELQKIMVDVPTLRISTIEFNYRRIKSKNKDDDRWVITTNRFSALLATCSRNILAGRDIMLGVSPRTAKFHLRRYDDMLLLEFKKNLRAAAWANVLGTKSKSATPLDKPRAEPAFEPKKKDRKRKSKKTKSCAE